MKGSVILTIVAFIGIFLIAGMNANANGVPNEVWVDDDFDSSTPGWGYDHFASIQDGINAVAEGGIVHVADGTYYENNNEIHNCNISNNDYGIYACYSQQ